MLFKQQKYLLIVKYNKVSVITRLIHLNTFFANTSQHDGGDSHNKRYMYRVFFCFCFLPFSKF